MKKTSLCISALFIAVFMCIPGMLSAQQPENLAHVKQKVRKYYNSGQWQKDVEEQYAKALDIAADFKGDRSKTAIVLDIDETALTSYPFLEKVDFAFNGNLFEWSDWVLKAEAPAMKPALNFYKQVKKMGFKVYFVTGRYTSYESLTLKNLKNEGFEDYDGLVHRMPGKYKSTSEYKTDARKDIEKSGLRILLNIGDQQSDLDGGFSQHTLLLPNPVYFIP